MPPAIYRTGLVIAHLCLNVIAFLCLNMLLMVGGPKSNVYLQADDLTSKLNTLINEGTSSPTEFLKALDDSKIIEGESPSMVYTTGRKHFYVKDWKLVEHQWEVTFKRSKPQLDPACSCFDLTYFHISKTYSSWNAIERLILNTNAYRTVNFFSGSSHVRFPIAK